MIKLDELKLEQLSSEELDALIVKASEIRRTKSPQFPKEPPKTIQAIYDPAWYSILTEDNRIALNIRHPGLGWLAFVLPHKEAKNLFELWSKMFSLLAQTKATEGEKDEVNSIQHTKH